MTNNDTRPCNIQGNFDIPEFKFNALADKEVLDMVLTASSRNTGTGSVYQLARLTNLQETKGELYSWEMSQNCPGK